MSKHKNYTTQELQPILELCKKMFPVGSVLQHTGRAKSKITIRNHSKFNIVNDPNFPSQGICYGTKFIWWCGEWCYNPKLSIIS
jgi:hypothetical protein